MPIHTVAYCFLHCPTCCKTHCLLVSLVACLVACLPAPSAPSSLNSLLEVQGFPPRGCLLHCRYVDSRLCMFILAALGLVPLGVFARCKAAHLVLSVSSSAIETRYYTYPRKTCFLKARQLLGQVHSVFQLFTLLR